MDASNFFVSIFLEHVASATIVPFISSITLEAMRLFGGYDLVVPALVGVMGMVCGCITTWLLGYGLSAAHGRVAKSPVGSDALRMFMHRYGWIAAGFFWLPLASILLLALGFFRVSLVRVSIMVLLGGLFHMKNIILG
jgi:membrane protein YqaA with SNARE-associated domain